MVGGDAMSHVIGQFDTPRGAGIERCCLDKSATEEQIFFWFQGWIRNRLFRSLENAGQVL